MTTEPQPRLTDTRLDRRYQALLAALDLIVDAWDGAHNPPTPVGTGRRTPPRSKPPCSPEVLSALDAAWRDLRSWGQLVMEERDLTLGPRAMTGPDLALFLARHADWLARHEAAEDCTREMARHSRKLEAMAKGRRTRRVILGACPEPSMDEEGLLLGPCPGTLVALVHDEEDLLPAVVRCDVDREHAWTPSQWPALGRKLGRISPTGAQALVDAIAGRTVRYRVG